MMDQETYQEAMNYNQTQETFQIPSFSLPGGSAVGQREQQQLQLAQGQANLAHNPFKTRNQAQQLEGRSAKEDTTQGSHHLEHQLSMKQQSTMGSAQPQPHGDGRGQDAAKFYLQEQASNELLQQQNQTSLFGGSQGAQQMLQLGYGHNLSQQSVNTMNLANELNPQQPLTSTACQSQNAFYEDKARGPLVVNEGNLSIYTGLNSSTAGAAAPRTHPSQGQQVAHQKIATLKTLKAEKANGNGAVPSKVDNGTGRSDDAARTDFYVWGTDKHGQLGQNVSKKLFVAPRQCFFNGAERVKKVSCGDSHSAILTEEGLLYTFGSNQGGKLGIKDASQTSVKAPTLVEDLVFGFDTSGRLINRVQEVCCANSFTMAATQDGRVYTWGTNLYGALGLGKETTAVQKPSLVQSLAQQQVHIVKISGKFQHSIFLDSNGNVFMSGKGDKGQLGFDLQKYQFSNLYAPTHVDTFREQIMDVQAGKDFSLLLTRTEEVLACGLNNQGQLGLGDTQEVFSQPIKIPVLKNIKKIQCNEGSVALDNAGQMFIWGPVNKDKSLIIPTKVQSIPDKVVDCSIGKYTYSAIDERQMVWIWGENKQAQLGLSDYTQRATPYPLLSLKEKAIDSIHFGQNYAIAISKYPKTQEGSSNFFLTTPQNESNQMNPCSSDPKLLQTPLFNQMSRQHVSHSNPVSSPSPQQRAQLASVFLQSQQLLTEQNELNQREQHMQPSAQPPQQWVSPNSVAGHHQQQFQQQVQLRQNPEQNFGASASQQVFSRNPIGGASSEGQQQTSYITPSGYVAQSQLQQSDISSVYHTNVSQMYQHPVPSIPTQLQHLQRVKSSKTVGSDEHDIEASATMRTDSAVNSRSMKGGTPQDLKGGRAHHDLQPSSSTLGRPRDTITKSQRTGMSQQNEEMEAYHRQLESLVAQYEGEIEDLRASNLEQGQDLHTMIQAVNELKDTKADLEKQIKEKDERINSMKQGHDEEMQQVRQQNAADHAQMIQQIDMLTKQIEEVEETFQGPKNQYLADIQSKTKEITELNTKCLSKQKDLLEMNSQMERYKIQITSLNEKISELECANIQLKAKRDDEAESVEQQRLTQQLDHRENLNRQQQLIIEKLENRIAILEAGKHEEETADQSQALEKAQLQRKVAQVENQLRFQTNLNLETKKEIEKLDGELSQVANSCSQREQILQRKLEDALEELRQERVQSAAIKSDMLQRENHIEQLKGKLRQAQADIKLAKLENEALVRQCEYERQNIGKQIRDQRLQDMKSPNRTSAQKPMQALDHSQRVDASDSYLDLSYSQSPSLLYNRQTSNKRNYQRTATEQAAQDQYQPPTNPTPEAPYNYQAMDKTIAEKKQATYNQHLLKSIEKKTMLPVATDINIVNHNRRAQTFTDKTSEAMAQKRQRSPSPAEQPKQPGYTLQEQSKKYTEKVNNALNEMMTSTASEQKPSSAYKRTKSADPNTSMHSQASESKKKETTYIQKLLGLNRTQSSASNQYHNNVPSWQKLLKAKQQGTALPNPLERFQQNAMKRKLSFGRDSNGRTSSNGDGGALRQDQTVSMGDISRTYSANQVRNPDEQNSARNTGAGNTIRSNTITNTTATALHATQAIKQTSIALSNTLNTLPSNPDNKLASLGSYAASSRMSDLHSETQETYKSVKAQGNI